MLQYYQTFFFLILAIIGGVLGFTGMVEDLATTGKVLFGVCLLLALICFMSTKKKQQHS